jgi:hypothetical protein
LLRGVRPIGDPAMILITLSTSSDALIARVRPGSS